jgi:hypothetical protein
MGKITVWTPAAIKAAKEILGRYESARSAIPAIQKAVGHPVTFDSLRYALHSAGEPTIGRLLKRPALTPQQDAARFTKLVEIVRSKPIGFAELCDRLDLSPTRAKELGTSRATGPFATSQMRSAATSKSSVRLMFAIRSTATRWNPRSKWSKSAPAARGRNEP